MASEATIAAIRTAILEFDWEDYSLDAVKEADAEYADWLTSDIVKALELLEPPKIAEAAAVPGTPAPVVAVPSYLAVMYDEHGDTMDEPYYYSWLDSFKDGNMDGPGEIAVVTGSAMPTDSGAPPSYFLVDKVVYYDVASDAPSEIEVRWQMAKKICDSLNRFSAT